MFIFILFLLLCFGVFGVVLLVLFLSLIISFYGANGGRMLYGALNT